MAKVKKKKELKIPSGIENTTVFKKDLINDLSEVVCICEEPSKFRNPNDARLAYALGFPQIFQDLKGYYAEQILNRTDKLAMGKTATRGSIYLESFLGDFRQTPREVRANRVAIFDFETTGLSGYAVSLAIEIYDIESKTVVDSFYEILNTDGELSSDEAIDIHHISNEEMLQAETFEYYAERIITMLDSVDFYVGQNLSFDLNILEKEFERLDINSDIPFRPFFDTKLAGKGVVPVFIGKSSTPKDPTLRELAEHYNLIGKLDPEFHNAKVDVEFTRKVFAELINEVI